MYYAHENAFSLVELSIVLVILGLLTGGILAGQSLIRASQLRTIPREQQAFLSATQAFRDKYFALPGDMQNATQFWGRGRSTTDCVTNSAAAVNTPGVCDGNGNGKIELPAQPWNPNQSGENFQFWRQLQLAGLIEGAATGYCAPLPLGCGHGNYASDYAQASKGFNAYWQMFSDFTWGTGVYTPGTAGTNTFVLRGATTVSTGANLLTQTEMWNIDTKMDDGIPTAGVVVAPINSWGGTGACVTGPTNPTDGVYKLNENTVSCSFAARNQF